jgi:hypothetical protein
MIIIIIKVNISLLTTVRHIGGVRVYVRGYFTPRQLYLRERTVLPFEGEDE